MGETKNVIVAEGDCISSIAAATGHFPDTIWNDDANRELREKRTDPNVLLRGDIVVVPPLRPGKVACATGQLHRFRRKGIPEKLKLRLLDEDDAPRAGLEYRLVIGEAELSGVTDGDGYIEQWVPNDAKGATLMIGAEEFDLAVGSLDPVESPTGLAARLENLGYLDATDATELVVAAALRGFQAHEGLDLTGIADSATTAKLVERHGS